MSVKLLVVLAAVCGGVLGAESVGQVSDDAAARLFGEGAKRFQTCLDCQKFRIGHLGGHDSIPIAVVQRY